MEFHDDSLTMGQIHMVTNRVSHRLTNNWPILYGNGWNFRQTQEPTYHFIETVVIASLHHLVFNQLSRWLDSPSLMRETFADFSLKK